MSDILRIRSKYDLWNEFVVEGMKANRPKEMIRAQIMEAVRKEIFEQICWRAKVKDVADAPHTPENEQIVQNIAKQTRGKWQALMKMCNEHLATFNLITMKDLESLINPDTADDDEDAGYEIADEEDPEDGDWDGDGDEVTAEWPELNETEK